MLSLLVELSLSVLFRLTRKASIDDEDDSEQSEGESDESDQSPSDTTTMGANASTTMLDLLLGRMGGDAWRRILESSESVSSLSTIRLPLRLGRIGHTVVCFGGRPHRSSRSIFMQWLSHRERDGMED